MNNNFVLYLHIAPNGKKYFGITGRTPKQRWSNGNGYKRQDFYEAIEEFGWDNIEHYVLADDLTELEARMFEVMTIAIYNTRNPLYGYNSSPGGGILSEEARKKISEASKGRVHSEETKQKISEAHKGKVCSEEHRLNISKGRKGKYIGSESPNSKTVICLTTKQLFGSAREAGRYINNTHVSAVCLGMRKYAGKTPDGTKLVWRYLNYKHNNIYHIVGGYFVDNEKIARLIEESFGQTLSDEEIALLIEDIFPTDESIDYENIPDII